MPASDSPDDYQPITWIGGHPVRIAGVLVLFYVATMVSTALAMSFGLHGVLNKLAFSSTAVLERGAVWQFFTYAMVNEPSWDFVFQMALLWWFGGELEKFFGRRVFLKFYIGLLLLTPLLFTLVGLRHPLTLFGAAGGFAVFIAFATLYPNVLFFGVLFAKYIAAILVAVQTLVYLARHDWPQLLSLWATVAFAFGFVRYQQGRIELPSLPRGRDFFWKKKPHFRVVRDEPARAEALLEDLSDLFRHALVEQGEAVTLHEEVELARKYLDIEQVRFGERMRVQWVLDERAGGARVPPLLLQPLVENAVKHGVEPSVRGTTKLRIATELRGGRVVLTITNTLPAGAGAAARGSRGHGIALANVRDRLRLLHDVDCDFRAGPQDGLYHVRIALPAA